MKTTRTSGYQALVQKLKDARKAAGLSQEELARRLGRGQSFVSKYERAHQPLDVVEFVEVTKALGIDPKDALGAISQAPTPRVGRKPSR